MKKRVLSLLLVFVMVLGLLPSGVLAAEGGTEVSSQEDLAGMTDGRYILTADIGLSEWTAIDFSGTLDGNGHTITLAGQPLFNELSGNVQNLCLSGEVTDEDGIAGALARTQTGGSVNNCWSGAEYDWYAELFAGFIGTMTGGTIKNRLSTCDMGDAGLVAEVSGQSAIENCYYTHYNAVYDGEFTGSGNESISSSDYERVMVQLNGSHEEGLLYWAVDTDGVPKPTSDAAPEADDAALQALYDSVKDMTNTVPDEEGVVYAPESWAEFEAARTEAKAVLDSADTTQAVIDAAKEALQAALNGLIPDRTTVTAAEREALEAEIANAPSEKGRYTDASFAAVQTALKPAEALLQNPAATATELTEKATALQNAIAALAEIADPSAVTELPEGQEWAMISTAEELAKLSENGGEGYYKLANDMNDVSLGGSGGATVTGVTLTPGSAKIEFGKTVRLKALVIPATATNKNVTFSSSKPEDQATVTLSIDKLTINKGYVLEPTEVKIKKGETVWDVLKRELDQRGIRYQYSNNSQYNSVYVESIDGDGEFDHGSGSG